MIKYGKEIKDLEAMDASDNDIAVSDEEAEDADEEVYVVKKILEHKQVNGRTLFKIRWEGYSSEDDTWEGEENILDRDILKNYWDAYRASESQQNNKARGRPRKPLGGSVADGIEKPQLPANKRRRTREDVAMESEDASDQELPAARPKGVPGPESDDWEACLEEIVTIGQYDNEKFFVIIKWKNGTSTEHPIEASYAKCPQSMLKFYEARLRFRSNDH